MNAHRSFSLVVGLVAASLLAMGPALAKSANGNGGANASSNGNGASQSASAPGQTKESAKNNKGATASSLGKLNGFLNASPKALAKASPKSAIGKVAKVYGGLLAGFLDANATTPVPLGDLAAALEDAANKPLTEDAVAAVNAKLASVDPNLASAMDAYAGGAPALASDIAAAGTQAGSVSGLY